MKILVIGLGSMGKRRIRNLTAIGNIDIAGFDIRKDRTKFALEELKILVYDDITNAINDFKPNALIVSTSPESHMKFANVAEENGLDCFIEASVTDIEGIRSLCAKIEDQDLIFAPSCTMKYFSGPRIIKNLISEKIIGDVLSINYQTGQYLPDWHPWEDISDYYVSRNETGGAREIVPFELTWLKPIFGEIQIISCIKAKLGRFIADIDDYYQFNLRFNQSTIANITIEVLSRPFAMRKMNIIGTEGTIRLDSSSVSYATSKNPNWITLNLESGTVVEGYINPEEPYIMEMQDFLTAVQTRNKGLFPNSLKEDADLLELLNEIETASEK
jgi:predicted dehydrogenase